MDFENALAEKIAEAEAQFSGPEDRGLDAWGMAEVDYLREALERLRQGTSPAQEHTRAVAELPQLEEDISCEEALPTFDWYDDHYHEKIANGKLAGCKTLIRLYEETRL